MKVKLPALTLTLTLSLLPLGQTFANTADPAGREQLFSATALAPITGTDMRAAAALHTLPSALQWVTFGNGSDRRDAELAAIQTPDGIVLYGRSGDIGTWTLQWSSMLSLDLPEIGWRRLHRPLRSDADCALLGLCAEDAAYCPEWRRIQLAHRARIRQAFMPGYRIRDRQGERLALPPWRESGGFATHVPASFNALDPESAGPMRAWRADGGHFFALVIPWSAWPLTTHRVQRSLYLHAQYCPEHGPCQHASAAPDAALEWQLPTPLQLDQSVCDEDVSSDDANASFRRIADSQDGADRPVTHTFTFENPGGGYLDRPDPDRLSPELWTTEYRREVLEVDGSWSVCLPSWQLTDGAAVSIDGTGLTHEQASDIHNAATQAGWSGTRHPYWDAASPRFQRARGDVAAFAQQRLDERRLLLLLPYRIDPPLSGEGMNGACDRARFSVWLVDNAEPSLRLALTLDDFAPDLCAGSALMAAELSADGRYVDNLRRRYDYDAADSTDGLIDIRERHCLDDVSNTYLLCRRETAPAAD